MAFVKSCRVRLIIFNSSKMLTKTWYLIDYTTLNTIQDLQLQILQHFNFSSDTNIKLILDDFILPNIGSILLVRDDDFIRVEINSSSVEFRNIEVNDKSENNLMEICPSSNAESQVEHKKHKRKKRKTSEMEERIDTIIEFNNREKKKKRKYQDESLKDDELNHKIKKKKHENDFNCQPKENTCRTNETGKNTLNCDKLKKAGENYKNKKTKKHDDFNDQPKENVYMTNGDEKDNVTCDEKTKKTFGKMDSISDQLIIDDENNKSKKNKLGKEVNSYPCLNVSIDKEMLDCELNKTNNFITEHLPQTEMQNIESLDLSSDQTFIKKKRKRKRKKLRNSPDDDEFKDQDISFQTDPYISENNSIHNDLNKHIHFMSDGDDNDAKKVKIMPIFKPDHVDTFRLNSSSDGNRTEEISGNREVPIMNHSFETLRPSTLKHSPSQQNGFNFLKPIQQYFRNNSPHGNFREMSKKDQLNTLVTNRSIILQNTSDQSAEWTEDNQGKSNHFHPPIDSKSTDEIVEHIKDQKPEPKDYAKYPAVIGPPRIKDIIAFKVLELSADYSPEVSEFREAQVLGFNPENNIVELSLLQPVKPTVHNGRFDVIDEEDQHVIPETHQFYKWSDLIEPKLLA